MYEAPGSDITNVILNEKVVQGLEAATYIRSKSSSQKDKDDNGEDSGCEDDENYNVSHSWTNFKKKDLEKLI